MWLLFSLLLLAALRGFARVTPGVGRLQREQGCDKDSSLFLPKFDRMEALQGRDGQFAFCTASSTS